jgi:hypothetical protein
LPAGGAFRFRNNLKVFAVEEILWVIVIRIKHLLVAKPTEAMAAEARM